MQRNDLDVFVVGAGVIGLSTAILALDAGFNVTIFAEIFPADEKSTKYASCWAGADHISFAATGALMHRLEQETFGAFMGLLKEDPLLQPNDQKTNEHLSKFYSDFRTLDANELPKTAVHGATFSTLCIDVPRYLPYLMLRFLASGGRAFRTTLPSLSALLSDRNRPAFEAFPVNSSSSPPTLHPIAVINCTGIGALSIGDVLDTDVYPTRGEVLIIRAPWVQRDSTFRWKDGHVSYMIPRQSGDVILGGTFQPDDWHPKSRPETVKLIKGRGIQAFPELLHQAKRETRNIDDLDVVEECVGLRPTRKGGVRLEIQSLAVGERIIPIVHNYGHGGAGYQSSWGSATQAVELLKSVLRSDSA
ncbi:FAD dependent oxidoreductase [Mycena albidolilacea]|uniref:FAD dependent oxidoreductase n=1 Tax=Mycena albidolilacea TaxID=1033008 RepID=A0AAD6Z1D9_9AGAR|nr:FAD dependent oxidoreductase [Mycena albidolilacea]